MECWFRFSTRPKWSKHVRTAHDWDEDTRAKILESMEPGYRLCCGEKFINQSSYQKHRDLVHLVDSDQAKVCLICTPIVAFDIATDFWEHLKTVHADCKSFPCPDVWCESTFSKGFYVRLHFNKIHAQQRLLHPVSANKKMNENYSASGSECYAEVCALGFLALSAQLTSCECCNL